MSRSKYTQEFRDSTVELILNSEKTVKEFSLDLGIHVKTLHNWIRLYRVKHNITSTKRASSSSNTQTQSLHDELKQLRAENRILKQEREILKKAAAYFAKETL